ncbi:MAG: CPBP family intramembrane metalloprotease [Clostridiales bacterium]|nr:CPBP family intramembrane metalloprotease [Clostridiales bacterium]
MKSGAGNRWIQVVIALGKSLCYLILFLGMQFLVMVPVMLAAAIQLAANGGAADEGALYALLTEHTMEFSLISNLLILVFVLSFYLIRRKKLSEALWLRRVDAPALWTGAALAPGLYLVVTVVLVLLPDAWLESYSEAASGLDGGGVIGVLAVAVAAPVVEEFIFRGLIMTRLSRAMPGWLAVVLSAAIFGACHGHPVWFGYAFVLGVVFGFMDLRSGSIWPSILGHLTFNAIGQIFTLLPESEEGTEIVVAMGVLLVVGIIAPILDRKGIAALFRPTAKAAPLTEQTDSSRSYGYDPWDE